MTVEKSGPDRLRQAPLETAPLTYGIVGDGRLARHLCHYLGLKGIKALVWSRKSGVPPEAALEAADVLWIAISDRAIEPFLIEHPLLQKKRCVHFSGSLVSKLAIGVHPLMTFGNDLYDLNTYEQIPFVSEVSETETRSLFPRFSNPVFVIGPDPDLKARYHALCVLAGNCTVLLWQKLFREFEAKLGLPSHAAFPYLAQVTANLVSDPRSALTGPIARGDQATIERNLNSLENDPYHEVYRAFLGAHGGPS